MKDARHVPDVSKMLRDGLPYLTEIEATEVQLALAVSIYAHSKTTSSGSDSSSNAYGHPDDRVKVSHTTSTPCAKCPKYGFPKLW